MTAVAGAVHSVVLTTESRQPSGVGAHMLELARQLTADRDDRAGARPAYDVTVAAPAGPDARWLLDQADRLGVATWALPDDEPRVQAAVFGTLLRRSRPDLVHLHAGIDWEGHFFAHATRDASVPGLVRTEHLPFLITTDWQDADYRAALPLHDAVICVSDGVAESHRAAGVPEEVIRVVRNGISTPHPTRGRAEIRAELGVDEDAPLAVTVGRLTEQKGHATLLDAVPAILAAVPRARFVWVGRGPLEAQLVRAIDDRDLAGAITLVPTWDDVPSLLAAGDVTVFASRFEGLPLVALEAMAVGRPVVGTRVIGLEEAVLDGITGRLVPPDDPSALAAALIELMTDPARVTTFGDAGRERQRSEFGAARMAAEVAAVYEEVFVR